MFVATIHDVTSAAATAIDSGNLNLQLHPIDALLFEFLSSAADVRSVTLFDPTLSSTIPLLTVSTITGSVVTTLSWGLGCGSAAAFTNYVGGIPAPLPPLVQVKVAAAAAGITQRCRVVGVRFGR